MNIVRHKVTVPPPELCDPPCYHSARARTLERYIKKLRRELIVAVVARRKAEAQATKIIEKQKLKKAVESVAPEVDSDRDAPSADLEVVDLVTTFQKRGID